MSEDREILDSGSRLVTERRGRCLFIDLADVEYLRADSHYLVIPMAFGGPCLVRCSVAGAARQLAPHGFVRIHRSVVMNLAHVMYLDGVPETLIAVMRSGNRLRCGGVYRRSLARDMRALLTRR